MEGRRNHVLARRLTELVPQHVGIEWPRGGVEGHQALAVVGPVGDHDCTLADAGQPQECVLNLADLYPEATDLDLSIAAIAPALPRLGRAPPAHLRDRRPRVSGVRRSPAVPPPRSKIRPWSRGFCATFDCRPRCPNPPRRARRPANPSSRSTSRPERLPPPFSSGAAAVRLDAPSSLPYERAAGPGDRRAGSSAPYSANGRRKGSVPINGFLSTSRLVFLTDPGPRRGDGDQPAPRPITRPASRGDRPPCPARRFGDQRLEWRLS